MQESHDEIERQSYEAAGGADEIRKRADFEDRRLIAWACFCQANALVTAAAEKGEKELTPILKKRAELDAERLLAIGRKFSPSMGWATAGAKMPKLAHFSDSLADLDPNVPMKAISVFPPVVAP